MKLHEYQSKLLFAQRNIPIPKGRVAATAQIAKEIAEELGGRVVIKAQVLAGGRGKAGGIRLARTPSEAKELATQILGMTIKGLPVRRVLVDEAASIAKEIYLSISNDRAARRAVVVASAEGGVGIEEAAQSNPENIFRTIIDPLVGFRDYQARDLASAINLPHEYWKPFSQIALGLFQTYTACDATLVEINPLVITSDHRLLALDGKMVIDDSALFRHPDLLELRDLDEEKPEEIEAHKYGLAYVKMDGDIGCMVNGAGLAMTTMDIIQLAGGHPANFLDIGGGATAEKVTAGLRIVLSDSHVRAVLINIFGGITRCDEVARGVLGALDIAPIRVPIIIRLEGTNEAEGRALLAEKNLQSADSLLEAAQKAIMASQGAAHIS
jgi:succinyl-CoA synthetase beta subunit